MAQKLALIVSARNVLKDHVRDNGTRDPYIDAWVAMVDEKVTAGGAPGALAGDEEVGIWALPWLVPAAPAAATALAEAAVFIGTAAMAALAASGIIAASGIYDAGDDIHLDTQAGAISAAASAELLTITANRVSPTTPPAEGDPETRWKGRTRLLQGSLLLAAASAVLGTEFAGDLVKCIKPGLFYAAAGFAGGYLIK